MKLSRKDVKKHYDRIVKDTYKGDYEHFKWFSTKGSWQRYLMHYKAIEKSIEDVPSVKRCLELGPGSGIWTKQLLFKFPNADFDLVDISKSMINQAKSNLGERKNFNFINKDIIAFSRSKKYDLIFASRVIEYIPEKERLFKKLLGLLSPNGKIVLITKVPGEKTLSLSNLKNILGISKKKLLHTERISPREAKSIFNNLGVKNVRLRPVSTLRSLQGFFIRARLHEMNISIFEPLLESYMIEVRN
jgi:ubiquinone/menaquinone biosynthesis C-methylase UbiE